MTSEKDTGIIINNNNNNKNEQEKNKELLGGHTLSGQDRELAIVKSWRGHGRPCVRAESQPPWGSVWLKCENYLRKKNRTKKKNETKRHNLRLSHTGRCELIKNVKKERNRLARTVPVPRLRTRRKKINIKQSNDNSFNNTSTKNNIDKDSNDNSWPLISPSRQSPNRSRDYFDIGRTRFHTNKGTYKISPSILYSGSYEEARSNKKICSVFSLSLSPSLSYCSP